MHSEFQWEQPWKATTFAVIDVEGNGQQPPDLVEIAVATISNGARGDVYSSLVRPPRPITAIVRRIHGISNDAVANAPLLADVAAEFSDRLHGKVPLGHHVRIDIEALARQLPNHWQPPFAIDTLLLAKRVLPAQASYSLGNLRTYLGLQAEGSGPLSNHRAGSDVIATCDLFQALLARLDSEPTLRELFQLAGIEYSIRPPDNNQNPQCTLF